jgi:hypothetical protein
MNFDFLGEGEQGKKGIPSPPANPLYFMPAPEVEKVDPVPVSQVPTERPPPSQVMDVQAAEPPAHPDIPLAPLNLAEYKEGLKSIKSAQTKLEAAASKSQQGHRFGMGQSSFDIQAQLNAAEFELSILHHSLKKSVKGWRAFIPSRQSTDLRSKVVACDKQIAQLRADLVECRVNRSDEKAKHAEMHRNRARAELDEFTKLAQAWTKKYDFFLKPAGYQPQALTPDEELQARERAYRRKERP